MRRAVPVAAALWLGLCPLLVRAQETGGHGTGERIEQATEEASGRSVETGDHDAPGHETEHHEVVPWYKNMDLWKAINLGVIIWVVMRMAGGDQVGPNLRRRSDVIRTELDEARLALETAEKRLDDAEFRLARLHDELESLRQQGRQTAQSEQARLLAEAEEAAAELGRRTKRQIELETAGAKRELRRYMAGLIVQRVRENLKRRVEREGDAPFVNTILDKVEALS